MQWRMIKRKFEDDSIKYPVDVQKSTMKAKVDEVKKHEDSAYYRQDIPEQPIDDTPFIRNIANTNVIEARKHGSLREKAVLLI